jgi:thiol-disulfide isomerase/thioredoxin
MATWCPQCRDELPMMSNYAELLGDQMNILVVDVGEDRDTVKAFMKDLNFKQLVGVDDGSAQRAWGTFALPVHYWLDADGIVQDVVYGGAPPQIFIEAITDLVPDFSANFPTPTPLIPVVPTFSFPPVESPSPTAADQG